MILVHIADLYFGSHVSEQQQEIDNCFQILNMKQAASLNKAANHPSVADALQMQPNFRWSHMLLIRADAMWPGAKAFHYSELIFILLLPNLPQSWQIYCTAAKLEYGNLLIFLSFIFQLCFGRWGLPLTKGPGQGPVYPHHRGKWSWENWWELINGWTSERS